MRSYSFPPVLPSIGVERFGCIINVRELDVRQALIWSCSFHRLCFSPALRFVGFAFHCIGFELPLLRLSTSLSFPRRSHLPSLPFLRWSHSLSSFCISFAFVVLLTLTPYILRLLTDAASTFGYLWSLWDEYHMRVNPSDL